MTITPLTPMTADEAHRAFLRNEQFRVMETKLLIRRGEIARHTVVYIVTKTKIEKHTIP